MTKELAKPSALALMAGRLSVEPDKLLASLKATVFKGASNEELIALVVVANEYGLNPFLKEIYAFPAKGGGIQPVVPVDGWTKIINRQPKLDGIDFHEVDDDEGNPISKTCTIWIKGRKKPVVVPERFKECYRNTEPWKQMPHRMLRHKALMQCARYAFGLSGIADEDEARDAINNARAQESVPLFDVPTSKREVQPIEKLRSQLKERGVSEKVFCRGLSLLGYEIGDIDSLDELRDNQGLLTQLADQPMNEILDEMEDRSQPQQNDEQ